MSENHANFFASAVPGNESSITTGSNGDQRGREQPSEEPETEATHEARHGRHESIIIGENDNGRQRDQPTPDDDLAGEEGHENERALDEESINLMDDVVESFRSKEITKLKALSNIITILDFDTSRTEKTKDVAVEYYSRTLDEIEALATSAVKRGEHVQRGLQPTRGVGSAGTTHLRNEQHDADIDELISQVSRESKTSKRPLSGDFFDADDDANDSDVGGTRSNKKRRIFESQMPWFSREEEERRTGNKECEESRRILALYARDFKAIKQWIQNSRTAPLGFPSSEWDNIVRGQAVNLDAVLSSLHHISAPKENVGRVGSTEISLGRSEPSKKVQTSGEWTSAWNAAIKAIKFAFPHREHELREYGE